MYYTKNIWKIIWHAYTFKRMRKDFFFFLFYEKKSTTPYMFNWPIFIYLHNGKIKKRFITNKFRVGSKMGYYVRTRNLKNI